MQVGACTSRQPLLQLLHQKIVTMPMVLLPLLRCWVQVGACTPLQPLLALLLLHLQFITLSVLMLTLLRCCWLQVGACTSLQPLLALRDLQSLVVTGATVKSSSSSSALSAVPYSDLAQLKGLTHLRYE